MSNIFISYSHKGRGPEWKRRLLAELAVFEKHCLIDSWDDEQIPGGYRWEREIEKAIHNARLVGKRDAILANALKIDHRGQFRILATKSVRPSEHG